MSRIKSSETITADAVVEHRTWRTEILSDLGSPYRVNFHREEVTRLNGEPVAHGRKIGVIPLVVQENLSRQVTAAGVTVTVGQLAALVAQLADDLEAEAEQPVPTPEP